MAGRKDPADAGITGTSTSRGEARWFDFPVVPGQSVSVTLDDSLRTTTSRCTATSRQRSTGCATARTPPGSRPRQRHGAPAPRPRSRSTPAEVARHPPPRSCPPPVRAADLGAADLRAADLRPADLRPADLRAAHLRAADLRARLLQPGPRTRTPPSAAPSPAAQNQTLLAVSADTGPDGRARLRRRPATPTGTSTSGCRATTTPCSTRNQPFQLTVPSRAAPPAPGSRTSPRDPRWPPADPRATPAPSSSPTPTSWPRRGTPDTAAYLASLAQPGVDHRRRGRRRARLGAGPRPQDQADAHRPARTPRTWSPARSRRSSTSTATTASKYVVIAGGDDVIPFFRYPDTAGLGPESEYVPPVLDATPSQASLRATTCSARTPTAPRPSVTVAERPCPCPTWRSGRLVETPARSRPRSPTS